MDNCDWCNLSEEDKQFQVYESKSWSVFLSDEQDYIGRCILVLNRHCNSLSELTDDESWGFAPNPTLAVWQGNKLLLFPLGEVLRFTPSP